MTLDDVRVLYAFDRWATGQLLDAAASCSQEQISRPIGGSFGSLLATAVHLVGASWIWLERFRGRSPRAFEGSEALTAIAAVRARADEVADGFDAYLASLSDGDLGRSISYTTLKGDPFTMPLGGLLQHVVNHGTYHRGQIAMALRLLGVEQLPPTDLVLFLRQRR